LYRQEGQRPLLSEKLPYKNYFLSENRNFAEEQAYDQEDLFVE
jgi:hypothetical protein